MQALFNLIGFLLETADQSGGGECAEFMGKAH